MYFHKIPFSAIAVFVLSFGMALASYAEEHGEKKEEHAEASEHGGGGGHEGGEGGGHEAAGGGHEGGEGKSSLSPWVEIENKITELNSKILSKKANIEHLIEEKNHLPNNSPELKHIVQEIVKEHKEMRSLAEEYEKNVTLLKYRFPERNAKSKREYDRIEVKSVEEMEHAIGVDGKLNRNLKKMRTQFKSDEKPVVITEHTKPEAKKKKEKKEPSIEEAGSILLHK